MVDHILSCFYAVRRDLAASDLPSLHMNPDEKLRSLFLVSFPCALLATLLYTTMCWTSKENVLPGTRAALVSLYAFITPTQSFWPPQYLSVARAAATSTNKTIRLPLGTLYSDLLDDVVQLRYLGEHLPLLFANKLSLPAPIRLQIELIWWWRLLCFMFSCYMRSGQRCVTVSAHPTFSLQLIRTLVSCSLSPNTKAGDAAIYTTPLSLTLTQASIILSVLTSRAPRRRPIHAPWKISRTRVQPLHPRPHFSSVCYTKTHHPSRLTVCLTTHSSLPSVNSRPPSLQDHISLSALQLARAQPHIRSTIRVRSSLRSHSSPVHTFTDDASRPQEQEDRARAGRRLRCS